MCGISGILSFEKKELKEKIKKMNFALSHRGKDDNGFFIAKTNSFNIAFSHNRLSILDLSEKSHQPMGLKVLGKNKFKLLYDDNSLLEADYVLVFNGEIYNFKELRKTLLKKGIKFESDGDTEVLLKAYALWGESCLPKLNGMWAFAIYDKVQNKIFLSRDRLGVKPLFYYYDGDNFYFASEIKALKQVLRLKKDKSAFYDFITYNYIPAPKTLYKGLKKLKPAYYLHLDLSNKKISKKKYWSLDYQEKESFNKDILEQKINSAISLRLHSDAPMALLLSGGLDSQSIAYFLKKQNFNFHSFHFNSDEEEKKLVQKSAKDFSYDLQILKNGNQCDLLKIIKYYDEPMGDSSSVPMCSLLAGIKKAKVLLSGDGGDELFFGYGKYKILFFLRIFNFFVPLFLRKIIFGKLWLVLTEKSLLSAKTRVAILLLSLSFPEQYLKLSGGFTMAEKKFILPASFLKEFEDYDPYWHFNQYFDKKISFVKKLQKLDFNMYLLNYILRKTDTISMYFGIELRSPFLDYRLFEYLAGIYSWQIFSFFSLKKILKKIMKNKLPKYILKKKKQGFGWRSKKEINVKNKYLKENKKYFSALAYEYYQKN